MKRLAVIAAVLVLIVWLSFDAILLRLPGLIDGIRNPIGPNREVEWERGPATAAAPAAQRPPNIVVIVADSPIEAEFVWTLRNVGIDHVLLGSDYPQYSLEQNLSALGRLALDEGEQAKIRYENARALLGLR